MDEAACGDTQENEVWSSSSSGSSTTLQAGEYGACGLVTYGVGWCLRVATAFKCMGG
jgi:hypothetical protein